VVIIKDPTNASIRALVQRTRAAQGLARAIDDPAALARVAALLVIPSDNGQPPRRRSRRNGAPR